jgi:hypothetical protein
MDQTDQIDQTFATQKNCWIGPSDRRTGKSIHPGPDESNFIINIPNLSFIKLCQHELQTNLDRPNRPNRLNMCNTKICRIGLSDGKTGKSVHPGPDESNFIINIPTCHS